MLCLKNDLIQKDRYWRKTRSSNEGSACLGKDPNRNFNYQWEYESGTSNDVIIFLMKFYVAFTKFLFNSSHVQIISEDQMQIPNQKFLVTAIYWTGIIILNSIWLFTVVVQFFSIHGVMNCMILVICFE